MRVSGAWMARPATQAVCAALTGAGHQALFVGGCVRNALLGVPVTDVDIATEARPERVSALAEAAGLRAVPTGAEHGTITVVSDGIAHEITTFRRDVETDGRRAVIAYADDMRDDARRRDFTMNALYARPDGTVIDPLETGLADLQARRLRFVGTARNRIREDYLRILRFFRFHAWYGDDAEGPDPDALAACAELAEGLERLSRERIGAETAKLLAAPDPAPSVAIMARIGVLGRILPGADAAALAPLVHLEAEAGIAPDWRRRLACIGGQAPGKRLRLSRDAAQRVERLHAAVASGDAAGALGYRHGDELGRDALLLRAALTGAPMPEGWAAALARGAAAEFPVRARDLMPDHQGPALGRRLAELEAHWIASDFTLTRDALLG